MKRQDFHLKSADAGQYPAEGVKCRRIIIEPRNQRDANPERLFLLKPRLNIF